MVQTLILQFALKVIMLKKSRLIPFLGLIFTTKLSWNIHINNIAQKASKTLNMLIPLKFKLDRMSLEVMFMSFVSSSMYYAVEVWRGTYDSYLLRLE